jgi:hypothetical protein
MDRAGFTLDDNGDANQSQFALAPERRDVEHPINDPTTAAAPAAQPAPITTNSPATAPASGAGVPPPTGTNPSAVPSTPATQPTAALPTPAANQQPALPADIQARLAEAEEYRRRYQELAQHQHLIPLGMEAYRRAQQGNPNAAPQPAAAQPQHPWGLPQFDMRLLDFVGRDGEGNLVLKPGAPPDALIRVQEYQAKLREAQSNFFNDPMKALEPVVKQMFGGMFQEHFQKNYGQIQARQAGERIIEENRSWLYAKDPQGNPVTRFNPASGQHEEVLSAEGQAYSQLLAQGRQYGIQDPTALHQFAVQGLTNMILSQRFQQQQNQQAGVQQQQQMVSPQAQQTAAQQLGAHNPNVNPAPAPAGDLRSAFRNAFRSNGVTDDVLAGQVNRVPAA